jgi:hypothetical protein
MYAMLSLLSGGVLVILVYGLSFCPSATLAQIDDEETISRADQDGGNSNAEGQTPPEAKAWIGSDVS